MPGRHASTETYAFGFQGQRVDNEIKGTGNSVNYKYRMHDPRLGRFFAVDPLAPKYPELTPYQFSSNNTTWMRELEGLEGIVTTFQDGKATINAEDKNKYGYGDEGSLFVYLNEEGGEILNKRMFYPSENQQRAIGEWKGRIPYYKGDEVNPPSGFNYSINEKANEIWPKASMQKDWQYRLPEMNTFRMKQVNILPELLTIERSDVNGDVNIIKKMTEKQLMIDSYINKGTFYSVSYDGKFMGLIGIDFTAGSAKKLQRFPGANEWIYAKSTLIWFSQNPKFESKIGLPINAENTIFMEKFVKAAFVNYNPISMGVKQGLE